VNSFNKISFGTTFFHSVDMEKVTEGVIIVKTPVNKDGIVNQGKPDKLGRPNGSSGMSIFGIAGNGGGNGIDGNAGKGRLIFGSLFANAVKITSILGRPKSGIVGSFGSSGMSISFGKGGGKEIAGSAGSGRSIFGSLDKYFKAMPAMSGIGKSGIVGSFGSSGMSISFGSGGGNGMPNEIGIGIFVTVEKTVLFPYFPSLFTMSVVMPFHPKRPPVGLVLVTLN
jgi:hypothetical protein